MAPIETRLFNLHPELLAWPSYRLSTQRMIWAYGVAAGLISFLLVVGMRWPVPMSFLVGLCAVAIFYGFGYLRYLATLRRPQNRSAISQSRVRIDEEEIRQEFSDGSHVAFKWFAVTRLSEAGDFFWVFAPKRHMIVVPKSAFESPDEARSFWSTVRAATKP